MMTANTTSALDRLIAPLGDCPTPESSKRLLVLVGFPRVAASTATNSVAMGESAMRWKPIKYRDFWDRPRIFFAEDAGSLYLFDFKFDSVAEDYRSSAGHAPVVAG